MILGLGADLVAIARVEALLRRHGERFLARLFTAGERAECLSRPRPAAHLAARLAAKEAGRKALGTGWSAGIGWRDLAVRSDARGAPSLLLEGMARHHADALGVRRALVSLSHDGDYAFAVVVAEGESPAAGGA